MMERDIGAIQRVLLQVLVLNLLVAGAKLFLGVTTGTISMVADGFHSLTDGASNVVGLIGIRIAGRPADQSHNYGHQKFETLAALIIGGLLALTAWEILQSSIDRLLWGGTPTVTPLSFAVMLVTIVINIAVTTYETRQGRALNSEVLLADAMQTRSDIFVSLAVIVSLVASSLGYSLLDVGVALLITAIIAWSSYQVMRHSADALLDTAVLDPEEIQRVVAQVPGVESSHKIRTRGRDGLIYADLHIQVRADMRLDEAHRLGHQVADVLRQEFPIADVVIHVEPPVGHYQAVAEGENHHE
jgi:cation diffusion facilitator family transporter